eukprot:1484002-Pyramimonas_sp.AAC.1
MIRFSRNARHARQGHVEIPNQDRAPTFPNRLTEGWVSQSVSRLATNSTDRACTVCGCTSSTSTSL